MERTPGKKTGTYKTGAVYGAGVTQTRFHMHVDNDLMEWLNQQVNKSRYINNLIREDMNRSK